MTIAESVSRIAKALANSVSSETPLLERLSQEQGLVVRDPHELARENYLMEISGCNESGENGDE